jgi:hypothetical protein
MLLEIFWFFLFNCLLHLKQHFLFESFLSENAQKTFGFCVVCSMWSRSVAGSLNWFTKTETALDGSNQTIMFFMVQIKI